MTDPARLVLVHGAELGSWIWEPLVARLQRPWTAVDLPGREADKRARRGLGLEDAARAVADEVRHLPDSPIVLVAHSFAGVLAPRITEALDGAVRAVVWLGATVPERDRSWVDLQPAGQRVLLRVLYRLRPGGVLSPRSQTIKYLANDLPAGDAEAVADRRVPEVPRYLTDRVTSAALPSDVRSHYVELLQDRALGETLRNESIARLPETERHELDSGHLPMLSVPSELATLLEGIASAHDGARVPVGRSGA